MVVCIKILFRFGIIKNYKIELKLLTKKPLMLFSIGGFLIQKTEKKIFLKKNHNCGILVKINSFYLLIID